MRSLLNKRERQKKLNRSKVLTMCMFSIIVPVFNTQECKLRTAINSIYEQSYDDYELIIVDDGSCAETAALCDALVIEGKNTQVYHQKNQGVSGARNFGISHANGDYIMFVDSDDVLGKYTLSECAEIIKRTDADYIFGGIKKIKNADDFTIQKVDNLEYTLLENIDSVKASFLGQNNPVFQNVAGGGVVNRGPYARAVKTKIAKEVPFVTDLKLGEDVVWNLQILNKVQSACFVNRIWYGYVSNEGSAIRKYYGNRHEILGRYIKTLYDNDSAFCERHKKEYLSNMVAAFHTVLRHDFTSPYCPLSEKQKKEKVKEILNSQPWDRMLKEKKILSFKHRVLVECSRYGCIFKVLKLLGE